MTLFVEAVVRGKSYKHTTSTVFSTILSFSELALVNIITALNFVIYTNAILIFGRLIYLKKTLESETPAAANCK